MPSLLQQVMTDCVLIVIVFLRTNVVELCAMHSMLLQIQNAAIIVLIILVSTYLHVDYFDIAEAHSTGTYKGSCLFHNVICLRSTH